MKILKRIKEISRSQISRERALTTTEQISAITHLVNSLEVLANDRNPRNAALVDWNLIKDEYSWAPRHVHDFLGFVSRPGVSRAIHVARAASAISLMIPGTHRHHRAAAGMFLSLTSVITSPRQHFGTDGSDQVAFLAQGVAALARMGEQQPRTVDSCLWFVGLQSSLSYFASGVAKAATSLAFRRSSAAHSAHRGVRRQHCLSSRQEIPRSGQSSNYGCATPGVRFPRSVSGQRQDDAAGPHLGGYIPCDKCTGNGSLSICVGISFHIPCDSLHHAGGPRFGAL